MGGGVSVVSAWKLLDFDFIMGYFSLICRSTYQMGDEDIVIKRLGEGSHSSGTHLISSQIKFGYVNVHLE